MEKFQKICYLSYVRRGIVMYYYRYNEHHCFNNGVIVSGNIAYINMNRNVFYETQITYLWPMPQEEPYTYDGHCKRKGRDLTQPYDRSPYTDRKSKKQRDNTKNATKNFDYTTIADRLRTVSWGNDSHPAGVVKPVYGIPTFPLTAKAV